MTIKSFLKKASLTLGAILLSLNIGCNSLTFKEAEQHLEQRVSEEKPSKLKPRQYIANFLGGYLLAAAGHETSHALTALSLGAEIEKCGIFYTDNNECVYIFPIFYNEETFPERGSAGETAINLAGPLGSRLIAETVNYNLRHGNISKEHQPFWAATSLMARFHILNNVRIAFQGYELSDLSKVSENTGISLETITAVVLLDTGLNYKRIAKEFRVAFGKDNYTAADKKSSVSLLPSQNGLFLAYTINF